MSRFDVTGDIQKPHSLADCSTRHWLYFALFCILASAIVEGLGMLH